MGLQHVQVRPVRNQVGLVQHQQGRVGLPAPAPASTALTARICASASGLEASTTCKSRSACRASSSVALNDATSAVRQVADEPDRVRQQHKPAPAKPPAPGAGIQGRKQLVLDQHAGLGQRVHQRALARVGITHQRNRRYRVAAGNLALLPRLDLLELRLQLLNPVRNQPAVFLELLFAGTSYADAPLVPRKVRPHPLQPRHGILELRQLDLQMGLVRSRVRREDVEDHLGAVNDLHLELLLEVARLRRPQVVVKNNDVRLVGINQQLQLLDLSRADISRDIDLMPLLQHLADYVQIGRLGQSSQLFERIIGRRVGVRQDHTDQDGTFLTSETLDAFYVDQGGI